MHVYMKLFNFEVQKVYNVVKNLCAHKPYFLMPGHILRKMMIPFLGAIVARLKYSVFMSVENSSLKPV